MIDRLIKAGADPNAPLTQSGDTALMMAARTGKTDAISVLLEAGAKVNAEETWGGTTALMWAVVRAPSGGGQGADRPRRRRQRAIELRRRGQRPRLRRADAVGRAEPAQRCGGVRQRLADAADVRGARRRCRVGAAAGGGRRRRQRDRPATARTRWRWRSSTATTSVASFLVDSKSNVNQADTQRFTPLFWAVDRRNMETAPNFPWMVTADPLPLIRKLLDAGANPNALVNNTPRARMRAGSPRIVFATPLMRAAFSGDLELVKLLLAHGADPNDHLEGRRDDGRRRRPASGFIQGYSKGKSPGRAARGREAVRRARRRRQRRPTTTASRR